MTKEKLEELEKFYSNESFSYTDWGERAWQDVPMLVSHIQELQGMLKEAEYIMSMHYGTYNSEIAIKIGEYINNLEDR